MDKEKSIISPFLNKINGDDAAIIGKQSLSADFFCEGVHFKKGWLSFEQIGAKAMLINISDAVAMNAVPKYALLCLALPKNTSILDIKALQKGIFEIAKKYKIQIIGGDTISSQKICLAITIIGELRARPIYRKGLKKGDLLAFTGKLGSSLKGLKSLKAGAKLDKNHVFIRPILRQDFFYKAASKISSAMDISDGLDKDLSRLLAVNKLGISFLKKLSKNILCSGEEYELLLGFNKKNKKALKARAKKARLSLNIFGKAIKGKYKYYGKEHHF